MEHYAKHSSDDPQIRVLPDGFAEPGRRRIRRLDNSGWAYFGFGAVTLGLLIPLVVVLVISLFVNGLKNPLTSNEVLMCLGLFVLLLPYLIGPVWYGWFVVSRPEFDFSDPSGVAPERRLYWRHRSFDDFAPQFSGYRFRDFS